MASISFVIRIDKLLKGEVPIQLNWTNGKGDRFSLSTGEKIPSDDWDEKNQKAVHPKKVKFYDDLNKRLLGLKLRISEIENQAKLAKEPVSGVLIKSKLKPKKVRKEKTVAFMDAFKKFIDEAPTRTNSKGEKVLKERTIKEYRMTKKHIEGFKVKTKYKVEFETIDKRFFDAFTNYLLNDYKRTRNQEKVGMTNNTIGKYIKTLRTMLNWSTAEGLTKATGYQKSLKVWKVAADIKHLSREQYQTLYDFDFKGDKRLEHVRDAFCFACASALRYQDIANLRWDNITEDYIQLRTHKTGQAARIPLNQYSRGILAKYEGEDRPLVVPTNQNANIVLKDIGKAVGFDEIISRTRKKGSEDITDIQAMHSMLSFHDARRTFVTLSLERGMLPSEIIKITGHTTIKMLEKYIDITDSRLKMATERAWSNPNLTQTEFVRVHEQTENE